MRIISGVTAAAFSFWALLMPSAHGQEHLRKYGKGPILSEPNVGGPKDVTGSNDEELARATEVRYCRPYFFRVT